MHIFFSGIGGTGIGPLALIAKQAGFTVSGSDKQESQYTEYLKKHGINLYIGQTKGALQTLHAASPIDWYVYSSALPLEQPNHPELTAVNELSIHHSKRDEFLVHLLKKTNKKLVAFAGTHGKTTSTAMAVWVAKQLNIPMSYSVGAKLSFGDMGHFDPDSEYFLYECDEFDRNFLHFSPYISVLSKVDWDHHEQYPTRESYIEAFKQFCSSSEHVYAHKQEIDYLGINSLASVNEIPPSVVTACTLPGIHNRMNAAGVYEAFTHIASTATNGEMLQAINTYPGSSRRFEKIADNLYSDYAHTPEEITATLQLAREISQDIVVVYEPLTNRRQHYMFDMYKSIFNNLTRLYWVPSYLAREDESMRVIPPSDFVSSLGASANATVADKNDALAHAIKSHLDNGSLVLLLAGGGGGSLDEWARKNF